MKFPVAKFLCQPCLSLGLALTAAAAVEPSGWSLHPAVQVDATGIHLDQIVAGASAETPHIRLAPAPVTGRIVTFTPAQINELLKQAAPEYVTTNWTGAAQVKVTRRTRILSESDVKELLTSKLQENHVRERGELELRFNRNFPSVLVADELLKVKLLELPSAGVTANFIARFEVHAGEEIAGTWQIPVTARIWQDVYVAGGALRRGQLVRDAELIKERRDVLALRDALTKIELDDPFLEINENIAAGMPLSSRSFKLRPIVHRGRTADAVIRDGSLTVSVKVEILEDGLPGQTIRVRNLKSKKEFRGKVQNEETITVTL